MKRVLIITYYFPPVKGAAPWRPFSWAKEFKSHGLDPTVLTRHWVGNESHWSEFVKDNDTPANTEIFDDYKIIHLPSKKFWLLNILNNYLLKYSLLSKVFYFFSSLFGYFNLEVDAYTTFKNFLKEHLQHNRYHYIMLTYPPSNLLKLTPIIKKYTDAKIIIDIRDLWNNYALQNNYRPSLKDRISNKLHFIHTRRYVKKCDLVTVVTPSFIPFFTAMGKAPVEVIYNGYEAFLFNTLKKKQGVKFNVSYIGNLYPRMDLSVLKNGLKLFLQNKSAEKVQVNFIGLGSNEEMKQKVIVDFPLQFLNVTRMLNKDEALQHTLNSDVLLHYGWKGFRGMIGTKTFDYLASGNNILLAPGDDDIVDDLLVKTNTGRVANTPEEFNKILNEWYNEWMQNGHIEYKGLKHEVEFYARENQAAIMAELLTHL
ncbi:MAG: hypothetical protein ABI723_26440 [Bacteroidia bacterium]